MATYLRTTVTAIGPDVADLLEGGVLILFADGAPPELAEVAVLHRPTQGASAEVPPPGAVIEIGDVAAAMTAIGEYAWNKVRDIGHVVVNFNGAETAERPGEIAAAEVDAAALAAALATGAEIVIRD